MPYLWDNLDDMKLRGDGPFIARSASDRTDDWPYWYVAGPDGRTNITIGPGGSVLLSRENAERLAHKGNNKPT